MPDTQQATFEIFIHKQNRDRYRTWFLLAGILNLLAIGYLSYTGRLVYIYPLLGLLIYLPLFIWEWKTNQIGRYSFFGWVLLWAFSSYFFIAVIPLLFALFAQSLYRKAFFVFSPGFIKSPLLFKPRMQWQDLQNVVWKDGLLSLDFRNNRLLQLETESGETAFDEQDFNDFCKIQIEEAYHKTGAHTNH